MRRQCRRRRSWRRRTRRFNSTPPTRARGWWLAAAYFFNKQLDLFEHEAQQAMALAPYDAEILAILGYMTAISGDWPRGVAMAEKANALNADAAAGWYHATLYLNYYLTGDYERALELIRQDPDQQSLTLYRLPPDLRRSSAASRKHAKIGEIARGRPELDGRKLREMVQDLEHAR